MEETEESGMGSFGYETHNWRKHDSLQHFQVQFLIILGRNSYSFLSKRILTQMLAD